MIRSLFEREVEYLWARLGRAARSRSELASLWSRDSDARVARLVQAAAYAFARVREKLEDDIPEISHALVAGALPEALSTTPSATVVQVDDDRRGWREPLEMEAGMMLASRPIDGAPCLFRTSWSLSAPALELVRADVRPQESGVQMLTLRLQRYPGRALRLPDTLRVFVDADDPLHALDVVHAVCNARGPLRVRALDERDYELTAQEVAGAAATWTALEQPLALGPGAHDRFASGSALRTFFGFPEAFGFFDLRGLELSTRNLPEQARSLELTLRLQSTLSETAMNARLHLACAPAVNAYETGMARLPVRSLGPCGRLLVPGHPAREVLNLEDVTLVPHQDPEQVTPVRLWESYRGHAYLDDELYLRVTRRAPLGRGPVEMRGTLLRPSGASQQTQGHLQARLLATDGWRTDTLLRGDVGLAGDTFHAKNITRVTPPRPPVLDARVPWRLNAYARMPVARFATAAALAAYLDLHDVTGRRRGVVRGSSPALAGILASQRRPATRVNGDEVYLGDEVDLSLDESVFGGRGAAWLVGELLARAIAERADFLRFTRTRTRSTDASGTRRTDHGVRSGHRLPPPFG